VRDARLQSIAQTFDYIASNPTAALRKYDVRYLAVRPSSPLKPNIGPDWKTVQTGEWQILEWTNPSSSD